MSAVSGLRKLVSAETSVAQNTAITGEKPHSMNTTIDTSDRKWNQYFLLRLHADSTRSKVTSCMPNLRTSISTIANSARSEEHTSELQSLTNLVCRLLLEKKKKKYTT